MHVSRRAGVGGYLQLLGGFYLTNLALVHVNK